MSFPFLLYSENGNFGNRFLLFLIFLLPFTHYFFGSWIIYIPIILSLSMFLLYRFLIYKVKFVSFYLLSFILLILVMVFQSIIFFNAIGLLYSLLSCILICLGYYLSYCVRKNVVDMSLGVLIFYYIFFVCNIFIYGWKPDDINQYLLGGSRNVVSTLAIYFQILYSVSYFRLNGKLPFWGSLGTLILSIFCYGRIGIFLCLLMFFFTLVFNLFNLKLNSKKKIIFTILAYLIFFLILSFIYYYYDLLENWVIINTNFERGLESPRTIMREEYINKLDLYGFFWGGDLSKILSISDFNLNPHNSFIYGHSLYGIFYLIFLLYFIVLVVVFSILRRNIVYIFFVIIYLVKAFFDKIALFDVGDFILYYILFSLLQRELRFRM